MPDDKYKELLELLPEDLKDGLLPAEKELLHKAIDGDPLDLRSFDDEEDNPKNAENWPKKRTIRAEFLRWLCVDKDSTPLIHSKGIQIYGARFKKDIDFKSATLPHPLFLYKCKLTKINLRNATTRSIDLSGSHTGPILAYSIRVEGSLHLRNGFIAKGEVSFMGATIKGDLICNDGTFKNKGGNAIRADGITVEGYIFLNDGFSAKGLVRFIGANIKGDLDCSNGRFFNEKWVSLCAERASISGDVYLSFGFHSKGEVDLLGAKIGGDLNCTDGTFENINGTAFNARRIEVAGTFIWDTRERPRGDIALQQAKVARMEDTMESWPLPGKLHINGFKYSSFSGKDTPIRPKKRLQWINLRNPEPIQADTEPIENREPIMRYWPFPWLRSQYKNLVESIPSRIYIPPKNVKYRPQPYEQLAKVLRDMGHDNDARDVYIAKQEALRKNGDISNWQKRWYLFLFATIRYGWKPWRVIVCFMLPMIAVAWVFFYFGGKSEIMVKMNDNSMPIFNSFVYAVDTFLPIINLHQEKHFLPNTCKPWGFAMQCYLWFHIAFGWVFTTIAVAALSGLIRKTRP